MAALVLALPVGAASGRTLPPDLTRAGAGVVAKVLKGDALRLRDGRVVRLVGLQAPKPAETAARGEAWPLAAEATKAARQLLAGRRVGLAFAGRKRDRYDRLLAHLVRQRDGLWAQQALLQRGWARVYSFPDNRAGVAELLAAERAARAAGRGIWAHPFYKVRQADNVTAEAIGTFQIVEGRVAEVNPWRGHIFLNFAEDYRGTFSARIDSDAVALFRNAAGPAPQDLGGRRVRVRGWLIDQAGPAVVLDHPERLEGPLN